MGALEQVPTQLARLEVKVDNQAEEQREQREAFKGLRTTLIVFALSIAGSAVAFGFAVLQLTK